VALPSDMVLYSHGLIPKAARFSILQTAGKIGVAVALASRYGAIGVAAGVAIWHWSINLFVYLPAACRVAEMSPGELWRSTLIREDRQVAGDRRANLIQGVAFIICAALLASGMVVLKAPAMFVACVLVSLVYAGIWAACTALPMWRRARLEAAAAP